MWIKLATKFRCVRVLNLNGEVVRTQCDLFHSKVVAAALKLVNIWYAHDYDWLLDLRQPKWAALTIKQLQ